MYDYPPLPKERNTFIYNIPKSDLTVATLFIDTKEQYENYMIQQ